MFGNIKPVRGEMKIKDHNIYRAYYCGLCRSMGARYKGLCNMGLSYEAVFAAILVSAFSDEELKFKNTRCIMHPLTKNPTVVGNSSVDRAAALNVLLIYHSLCDNVRDENDFKSRLAKIWFTRPYKKAKKENPSADSLIKDKLEDLEMLEESLCGVLDMAAQPFAELMGETALSAADEKNDDIYWFGFFMGKWLYVLDAFDDIEKDKESGAYNPFLMMLPDKTAEEVKNLAREDAEYLLKSALTRLGQIFDKLPVKRNKEIIENILFLGMPERTDEVLTDSGKRKKGERELESI